jgi:hypothetical protein
LCFGGSDGSFLGTTTTLFFLLLRLRRHGCGPLLARLHMQRFAGRVLRFPLLSLAFVGHHL